jgi:hypothetical protein
MVLDRIKTPRSHIWDILLVKPSGEVRVRMSQGKCQEIIRRQLKRGVEEPEYIIARMSARICEGSGRAASARPFRYVAWRGFLDEPRTQVYEDAISHSES